MRVGLVIYGRLDQQSGGYLYDEKLVAALWARGHEVVLLPLRWRGYGRALFDNAALPLARWERAGPFDLLLQDELNHPSLLAINPRLRARLRCPLVAIVHHLRRDEGWPSGWRALYAALERRYLRTVDGFVFNSQTTRAAVEGLLGGRRPSVVARPAGDRLGALLAPAAVARRARAAGPLRLVFVGNLIPRKRLHVLLTALARLPAAAWTLDIVGSDSAAPRYAQQARHLILAAGLTGRVRLHGVLDDAALAARLAGSDLLAVPSRYEGFGIVYLEGMGFGLPALATTDGAAQEIIVDGENGILVPPDDVQAIADRLAGLASDRTALAAMSAAALRRAAAHPGWAASTARAVDFLERLGHR